MEEKRRLNVPKPLAFIGGIVFIILFFTLSFWFVVIIILCAIAISFWTGRQRSSFLKLQKDMPTTPIVTVKEGLVEISGRVQKIESLRSAFDNRDCVAYNYHKFFRRNDGDGGTSTETIERKKEVTAFYIQDNTGAIEVTADELDLMWLPKTEHIDKDGIHHEQQLLRHNDEVLLIGEAMEDDGKLRMVRSAQHNIYNLSPVDKLDDWNTYSPILQSFKWFSGLLFMLSVALVFSNIFIESNTVSGNYIGIELPFFAATTLYIPTLDWMLDIMLFDSIAISALFSFLFGSFILMALLSPITKLLGNIAIVNMLIGTPFLLTAPFIFVDALLFWMGNIEPLTQSVVIIVQYAVVFVACLWNQRLICQYLEKLEKESKTKQR